MSLYHEAGEMLLAPNNKGGGLKSRIYSNKKLKSPPAQLYALVIEAAKWSGVLKEVIEKADLLKLERKITPILALLLVHDLLLSKGGIALPAKHGLRATIEKHKARLSAELTKYRIRRKAGSLNDLRTLVEAEAPGSSHPRWVRINTLKTQLEDQLETTFKGYQVVSTIDDVRRPGVPRVHIDAHIPSLVAVPPSVDLSKTEAYKSGAIIFQDKASCFPAYLLDPLPEDGDFIDGCAAPGNKTTHLGAILMSHHNDDLGEDAPSVYACEKDKRRADILQKMVSKAGAGDFTTIHAGQDFMRLDPHAKAYKKVGGLLLDPSCSGSGIIGRDEMPEVHLPTLNSQPAGKTSGKRKRDEPKAAEEQGPADVMVDDEGNVEVVSTGDELEKRLAALSSFQLELLQHAFTFPAAHKITYSTCSVHAEENEHVVIKALNSEIAKARGWRILRRSDQVRGMREWPVRGLHEACDGRDDVAEACIRANKDDPHGTMGFFLAGFVRDKEHDDAQAASAFTRDAQGALVRDVMGVPVRAPQPDTGKGHHRRKETDRTIDSPAATAVEKESQHETELEWTGFDDEPLEQAQQQQASGRHSGDVKTQQKNKKRKKSKRAGSS